MRCVRKKWEMWEREVWAKVSMRKKWNSEKKVRSVRKIEAGEKKWEKCEKKWEKCERKGEMWKKLDMWEKFEKIRYTWGEWNLCENF